MIFVQHARIRMGLLLSTVTLGGCVVGTAHVTVPDRLPSKTLPVLTQRISFDVCVAPDPKLPRLRLEDARRVALGDRVRKSLSRAGVSAELTAAAGSPADLTITLRDDLGPMWSAAISLMTFSLVPGYAVQRKTLNVYLAWRDAAEGEKIEHLQYQSQMHLLIWLPLIVSPDLLLAVSDGWESSKIEDGGFNQMVERLGDDIRARLGGDGTEGPTPRKRGVSCPAAAATTAWTRSTASPFFVPASLALKPGPQMVLSLRTRVPR
jgi:hypothetical protein